VTTQISRRDWLGLAPAALGLGLSGATAAPASAGTGDEPDAEPFEYGLNTSTIRGQKLTIEEEAAIAAKAGYRGIEPWIRELDRYVQDGGSLTDLGRRIADHGLAVESAIGFFEWAVDDDDRRREGFAEARRNMEMVRQIGGKRLAAPPFGATKPPGLDLLRVAERYHALLELGDEMGVVPQVEVWGFSQSLGRLGEAALVAMESGHPRACILPDVYHLHKGGSRLQGLRLLSGVAMHVLHMNDYPADPPRAAITDAHRVYPGDGVAPLREILRTLRDIGFRGMLSLELFNREYWTQDALAVARTGLEKMRAAVRDSLA
jgi:2-keto-myo-inositol isomerase